MTGHDVTLAWIAAGLLAVAVALGIAWVDDVVQRRRDARLEREWEQS